MTQLALYLEWYRGSRGPAGETVSVIDSCRDSIIETLDENIEELNLPRYDSVDNILIFDTMSDMKPLKNFWDERLHTQVLERLLSIMSADRDFKLRAVESNSQLHPIGVGIEISNAVVSYPMLSLLCFVIRNFSRVQVAKINDTVGAQAFLTKMACALAVADEKMSTADRVLTAFYLSTIAKKKSLLLSDYDEVQGPSSYIQGVSLESAKSQLNFKNFLSENQNELELSNGTIKSLLGSLVSDDVLSEEEDED